MSNGGFDTTSDPGIAIFFEGKIGNDRGFRFQTVIARDCAPAEFGGLVDKLRNEADRQQAIHSLDLIEAEIEKEMKTLVNIQADMKRVSEEYVRDWHERGKQGEIKLTSKEQGSLDNLQSGIVSRQNRIKELKEHAVVAAKKVNQYAPQQSAVS